MHRCLVVQLASAVTPEAVAEAVRPLPPEREVLLLADPDRRAIIDAGPPGPPPLDPQLPLVLDQVLGEQVIGVATVNGRAHLTSVSYDPVPGLLQQSL